MGLFDERIAIKPEEYPEFRKFTESINENYWLVSEYNFDQDIQDFFVTLNDSDRAAIIKTMFCISQIECQVKSFWAHVVSVKIKKPEVQSMAFCFSESEVRHETAYSTLLEKMGMNDCFEGFIKEDSVKERIEYLKKYQSWSKSNDIKDFIKSLLLFGIFVEGTSLMSQFLIMQSFSKYKNCLKEISTVVNATSKEEQLHAQGAFTIIRIMQKEYPELFDDEVMEMIDTQTRKAYEAEHKIVNWIFEDGELEFLSKKTVDNFLKERYNYCLGEINIEPMFNIDDSETDKIEWFYVSLASGKAVDFFVTRPTEYSVKSRSFSEADLF